MVLAKKWFSVFFLSVFPLLLCFCFKTKVLPKTKKKLFYLSLRFVSLSLCFWNKRLWARKKKLISLFCLSLSFSRVLPIFLSLAFLFDLLFIARSMVCYQHWASFHLSNSLFSSSLLQLGYWGTPKVKKKKTGVRVHIFIPVPRHQNSNDAEAYVWCA